MIAGEHFCSRGFHSAKEVKTVGPATPGFVLGSRLVFSYRQCGGPLVYGMNPTDVVQKSAWGKFHHIGNEKTPYSELIPAVEPTPGLSEE
jgi:hypothetical protein